MISSLSNWLLPFTEIWKPARREVWGGKSDDQFWIC